MTSPLNGVACKEPCSHHASSVAGQLQQTADRPMIPGLIFRSSYPICQIRRTRFGTFPFICPWYTFNLASPLMATATITT